MSDLTETNLIKLGFSQTEIKVINTLVNNKNVKFTSRQLELRSDSNNIKSTMSRIRKKVKQAGLIFRIKTVYGKGYMYFG